MDFDISKYISDSILQASKARATSTTGRASQLAAYLRLNSTSEHAGGSFSGGIEVHVPPFTNQVRVGCEHDPILEHSVEVCDAWIVLTGVYKNGRHTGIFHQAHVPLAKTVIQRAPQVEDTSYVDPDNDPNPTSPGTDFLTPTPPKRRFGFAAKRKSRQLSMHSVNNDCLSLPSPVGVGEPDGDGNMIYQLYNSKAVIPYTISVDPRLPNSFSCDGAEISYWLSVVCICGQYPTQDSVAFQARQVNVYQLESFISSDSGSSTSSTSSKVDMGGPGQLGVAAWLASPSFGVVEGTEVKVTLSICNFTKKKTQGIKLELFRIVKPALPDGGGDNMKKVVAEEVYHTEDYRFEPGYCSHVTVGIQLPAGLYSSNGIPEISISYSIKSSILIPLSESVVVETPVRIVRPYSFPEGTISKPLPKPPVTTGTQTIVMQEIPDNNIGSKSIAHEERLLKISQDLETLLADSVQSNDPHHYYSSTSSDDETTSSGSMFDSDIDETPPKLAYVLHVCKPVYTLRHTKKKPSINLTLKTTRHRYQNSFDSEETHNAGLTSDSSRLSHWASQPSVMSPRTPGEDSDEQHLMLRTMSAPNLGLPLDMQLQLKRLSIQTWYDSEESSLGDTYWPSGKIARRKHIRAIPWRSGFDEAHDDM